MVSFEQAYPHIASWVQDGCLEIGSISYGDDSFIRAIDESGTAWDSAAKFETLDDALAAASCPPPAQADIQSFFRVTPPTVHQMILKLDKLGLIARVSGEARSLRVLVPAEQLPILVRP